MYFYFIIRRISTNIERYLCEEATEITPFHFRKSSRFSNVFQVTSLNLVFSAHYFGFDINSIFLKLIQFLFLLSGGHALRSSDGVVRESGV
jgi:hypothetical protein